MIRENAAPKAFPNRVMQQHNDAKYVIPENGNDTQLCERRKS